MRALSTIVVLLALFATACGDDAGTGVAAGDRLTGRTFLSERVTGRDLVPGTQLRLEFRDDGELRATTGCNHLFGEVEIVDGQLFVDDMGGTEMGCDPERHAQDEWLMRFLGAGPLHELEGDRLRLTFGDITVTLLDREVADPDRPLRGTEWVLDGIIDGDTVRSMPGGVDGTLRVTDDRVEVEVCNQAGAPVTVTGGEIEVGALVTTDMACEEERMAVERTVHGVLDGTIDYEIEASTLTLRHPDGQGLLLQARD